MSSLNIFPSLSTLFRVFSLISVFSVSSIASLLYLYQGKLIYPANLPAGARTDTTNPSEFSLPFEDLWLKTPDREKLQAWFIRPDEKGQERKMTVVMFQANAGNIAHRLPLAAILYKRLAVNVLMLSYRGYGLSTGSPNEAGIKIDAQVALDWLKARIWPESKSKQAAVDYSSHHVILYGQSLGGAVAIDAAVRNGNWVKGLILENTFLDIPSLIPSVLPPARFFTWLCREIWSSRTRLPQLDKGVKVLFLSGKDDELVPPSHMRELYKVCRHKEGSGKEWSEFEEGTHNDTCMKPGYFPTIASFLHRHFSHATPLSREALSRGFAGTKSNTSDASGGSGSGGGEEEKITRELEEEYGDDWEHVEGGAGAGADETGGKVEGMRRRAAGAGGKGPRDVVGEEIEEIETEGVKRARADL